MGLRSGKAWLWERWGWGNAAGFLCVGIFAAWHSQFLEKEAEELLAGAELSELQLAVERALCLMDRSSAWWWGSVICGWLAAVAAWVAWRKRKARLEAAPPKGGNIGLNDGREAESRGKTILNGCNRNEGQTGV